MANLVELFDNIVQMQNLNGVPLANGKMYVYALGRTRLMDTWTDVDGESLNSNPIILDAAGQCHCYVTDDFDYTIVVTDEFNNEIFSIDKYLYSKGSHSHADVAVAPSETIAVSSYHVGETTVYVPYLTGQLGKVYEGIDPIVVNNTEDKISANHVPLGVQDPLYFVQDDEEGCIIGFSGQTVPEGVMTESALGFENNKITGYNGSAFSAGNEYEAGSYVDITDNTISVTGLQPEGDYAYNSALSSKLDVTATGQFLTGLPEDLMYSGDMTAYQPAGDYQTAGNYQTAGDYLSATDSANFLLTSDSGNFYPMEGNPSGFLTEHQSLDDYATKQWVEDKGYITGIDIQESGSWNEATTVVNNNSAIWNSTTETVSSNSAAWGSATPQIPVTGINGIKISESGDKVVFEVSGDYYTNDNPSGFITGVDLSDYATTAQLAEKQDSLSYGYHDSAISSIDESAIYDTSAHARINTLAGRISDLSSNKLDTTAFSDVSGTFLTAHQDLSDYQTTAGMTAYQPVGEYYSASNPSGFITGVDLSDYATTAELADKQDITGMTAYQPVGNYQTAGDYLTTADSANFYTTANESGFITGVDLTPYQLTADMTAYQPTGDYLTTADSANFYTTANESGFITGVPDTYLQNTDLTISDGKITEISGVPLSAGDELPESVSAATDYVTANSATINGTVETVSSNSGSWGGEALPLSSRDGIDLEIAGDMLYIGASALTASIDEKLDAAVYAADSGSFLTAHQSLDGYLQNTDLEISDNKITGISGVPLAAGGGGDVPEGVMAESGLEFNAVDEISGYNGSAFAQYGAEKQWLVHDDTLVHASNSAQYALGVNVSAVQTLMGMMGPKLEETTFAGYWNGHEVKQILLTGTFSTNVNSDVIPENSAYSAYERKWIDPSNSFIFYGSSANVLPSTWVLGATGRLGGLSLLNGIVRARSNDTTQTNCTAFVTIKWCEM